MKKVFGILRNNWKKSIFFGSVGAYGVKFGLRKKEENDLMKVRCQEASLMGQITKESPTRITVILNPAADSGKARSKYEDYCAPLLHLAGVKVSVIRTEGMGQAKEIMKIMSDADAVLIAGGDGTLMETITGLLRRKDANSYAKSIVLGVLPVGKDNKMAKTLFHDHSGNDVDLMSSATMSVLNKLFRPMDVIEIANMDEEDEKKLYGLRSFHIGAFRDVHERKEKFWLFGSLKNLFAYVFSYSTSQKEINWDLNGVIQYSETEELVKEVSNFKQKKTEVAESPKSTARWLLSFFTGSSIGKASETREITFKRIRQWILLPVYQGLELFVSTENEVDKLEAKETNHMLKLRLGPKSLNFLDFVHEGWSREKNNSYTEDLYSNYVTKAVTFNAGKMKRDDSGVKFSLDNESIELRGGLEISILPNKVLMFCSKNNHFDYVIDNDNGKTKIMNKKKWMQSSMGPSLSSPSKLI
uniref:Acylglycerol kinase, mitochondrial n=1 Tax=Lepeophtheirus salmonis TaxID=72036 RepID=A0A0K2THD1_LEPSM